MIIFTPKELRALAVTSRAEADEIQNGPISHFACDAVFDANTQASRYERDAIDLESAIAACNHETIGKVSMLEARVDFSHEAMKDVESVWMRAFTQHDTKGSRERKLATYSELRLAHFTAVAELLIAMGEA